MSEHSLGVRRSCLRSYIGARLNLFKAIHHKHLVVGEDHRVLATRLEDYALITSISFDPIFSYYYIRNCNWYRSDLSLLSDDDVPENVRCQLLHHLHSVLG